MFNQKLFASSCAAAFITSVMMSGGAQAVQISSTGAGQFLIGSIYMGLSSGYKTRVTVSNPTDNAIKAKVVLRSRKHSSECADFVLFLSPLDVAYFEITGNPADGGVTALQPGQAAIWSDDDSLLSNLSLLPSGYASGLFDVTAATTLTTFANKVPLRTVTLSGATATSGHKIVGGDQGGSPGPDQCDIGHIEVYGLYAAGPVGAVVNTDYGPVTVRRPMSKYDVAKIFLTNKDAVALSVRANGAPGSIVDLNTANGASGSVTLTSASVPPSDHANRVQLSGSVEMRKIDNTDRIVYPMVALRDGVTRGSSIYSYVIANPGFDSPLGAAALVGVGFGAGGSDTIADIDGALATTTMTSNYENGLQVRDGVSRSTNLAVTFPTKYRHRTTSTQNWVVTDPPVYNAPFATNGAVAYTLNTLDTQENSTTATPTSVCFLSPCTSSLGFWMTDEVNYIFAPTFVSTMGLHKLGFSTPMPALGYTHRYEGSLINSTWEVMPRGNVVNP